MVIRKCGWSRLAFITVTPSLALGIIEPLCLATTMSSTNLKQQFSHLPRELIDNLYTEWQYQSRLLWTASALTSLLSARHLLVESNYHFPLFLFPAQLIVATTVILLQYPWRRKAQHTEDPLPWRSYMRRKPLMVMGAMFFTSLSMVCMLQAILHSKNLPTLVMLTVSISARSRLYGLT